MTITYSSKPPCKGCTKRNESCHSTCEEYLDWREKHAAALKEKNEYEKLQSVISSYEINKFWRTQRRH